MLLVSRSGVAIVVVAVSINKLHIIACLLCLFVCGCFVTFYSPPLGGRWVNGERSETGIKKVLSTVYIEF